MSRRGNPQTRQVTLAIGSADRFGALVTSVAKGFVKTHPVISFVWLFGLLVAILGSGRTPAPEAVQHYEDKMSTLNDEALANAQGEMLYSENMYRRSKGMFWTCDEQCQANKREWEDRQRAYNRINREYLRGVSEVVAFVSACALVGPSLPPLLYGIISHVQAKSQLGLFSEDGVEETRDLFWRKVGGGKQFAKRATMWDILLVGIGTSSRRDEGLVAVIARVAFRFVINLTVGLFMAVVEFMFSIWRVIWSYQPDPLTTVAFFAMASLGAVSLLITWLLGLAAVGVAGVYVVAKVAETAQIEGARENRRETATQGQYVQQQQQQSYDQQPRQRRPSAAQSQRPAKSASGWDHLD